MKRVGVDLTWFMDMYLDRKDRPVGANGSVLTLTGLTKPTREEFRDAIVAFSTLAWLDGHPGADCWLFEMWSVPSNISPSDMFRRLGKFSVSYTDPTVERVKPSPYVYPTTLRADLPDAVTTYLRNELAKAPDVSELRALGQIHEVRFETPYFSSLGNDLEALWTAFESLFLRKGSAEAPVVHVPVPSNLLGALPVHTNTHPRRPERVLAAIRDHLREVPGIRAKSIDGIGIFLNKLWEARNAHSHAGQAEPPSHIEALETSVLSAGVRSFEALLRIRIAIAAGDDIFFLPTAVERLNEIFLREETVRSVVETLGKWKAGNWYPPRPEQRDELEQLKALLLDLMSFERVEGWSTMRDVAKARGFTRRVLNAWLMDLAKAGVHGGDVDALAGFAAADAATLRDLKSQGLAGAVLEDALDEELVESARASDVWRAPALDMQTAAPPLGGVIPLWLWVRSYIRLQELFLGYELI